MPARPILITGASGQLGIYGESQVAGEDAVLASGADKVADCIRGDVALAPLDLLYGIESTRPVGFGGLDRQAVDYAVCGRRRSRSPVCRRWPHNRSGRHCPASASRRWWGARAA